MDQGGAARRPRLSDVASRAGVSKKTVSNVVNDFPFVAAETRSRVLQAIEEVGYAPNLSARNLARGRTGVIALAIPHLDMPYFSELTRHVVEAAERRSWMVLIEQTMGDAKQEQRILAGDLAHRIDGIIFSPMVSSAAALRRRADHTPMVLLGETIYDGPFDHVSIDNVEAARTATRHLIDLGCDRVGAIGVRPGRRRGAHRDRYDGYRAALTDAGLELDPELAPPVGGWVGEDGEQAMNDLLALPEPPQAVFCFTDWLALGALRALHMRGLQVPDDVAVVGFDDIPYGRVSIPSLTTIRSAKQRIAETAADLLEQRVGRRREPPPREVIVDFELVVRESTRGIDRP